MRLTRRVRPGVAVTGVVLVLAGVLVVAVAALPGGTGETGDAGRGAGRGAATSPGLRAHLQEFRARVADRYALLVLTNRGDEPVTVDRLRLDSPDLRPVAGVTVDAVVAPGVRVDVPVRYGEARCDEDDTAGAGRGVSARVRLRAGDAAPRTVRLALPDPEPYVRRVVALDCQRHTLDEAADVRLAPDLTRTGPDRWRAEVVVERRDTDAAVDLLTLEGSVVYTVTPHTDAAARRDGVLVRLRAAEDRTTLPVTLGLPSCAPHLLTEAKKALVLPMRARVGSGPALATTLRVPPETSRRVLSLLAARCGGRQHAAPGSP